MAEQIGLRQILAACKTAGPALLSAGPVVVAFKSGLLDGLTVGRHLRQCLVVVLLDAVG